MSKQSFNAVLAAFFVFFIGILLFAAVWPIFRPLLPDDRLMAAVVLIYLFGLRYAGRRLARILFRSQQDES